MSTPPYLKQLLTLLLVILVLACGKQEDNLKITVQNQYVNFADSSQVKNTYSYKNDDAKIKATNVITYTIYNPTNKKYVLILNREYLYPHYTREAVSSGSIGYLIKEGDSVIKYNPGIIDNFERNELDCRMIAYQERVSQYQRLRVTKEYSLQVDEYLKYAVTIFPGENRTFKTITMLPVVIEAGENGGGIMRYFSLKEKYNFELMYYCNAAELKKELPKYLIDELKNNDVVIYDGILKADPVLLKRIQ